MVQADPREHERAETPDVHELRLRVTTRHGSPRTLRIRARQCSIGSREGCTLRMRDPSIHPVQCMIERDARGDRLRSLAPGTLLNGTPVAEARLKPGDVLGIGAVRLEILDTERAGSDDGVRVGAAIQARLESIEAQLESLHQERPARDVFELEQALEQTTRRLDAQRQVHESEQARWCEEREGLAARIDHVMRQNAELEQRLQTTQDRAEREQQRLRHQLDEQTERQQQFETERSELASQIDRLQDELAALEQQLAERQAGSLELQARAEQLLERLQESEAARDAARQAQEEQTAALAEQCDAWEARRQQLQQEAQAQRERAASLEREMSEQQHRWEQERQAWAVERDALRADIEHQKELAAAREAASPGPEDTEGDTRGGRDAIRSEAIEQATDEVPWADARSYDCAADEDRPDHAAAIEDPRAGDSEPTAPTVSQPTQDAQSALAALHHGEPIDGGRSDTGADAGDDDLCESEDPAEPLAGEKQSASEPDDSEPGAGGAPGPVSSAAPVSTAEVLARLGQAGIWRGDDEPVDEKSETPARDAWTEPDRTADRAIEPSPPESQAAEESDESIEDYMSRLLARTRGENEPDNAVPALDETGDRTPIVEPDWEPPSGVAESEETKQANAAARSAPLVARRAAPEGTKNLAAMRHLANRSTRAAIASHAQRSWLVQARFKLLAAAAGLGGGLVSLFLLQDNLVMALGGWFGGLGAAVLFGWQALRVRRKLMSGLFAVPPEEPDEPVAEDVAAPSAETWDDSETLDGSRTGGESDD